MLNKKSKLLALVLSVAFLSILKYIIDHYVAVIPKPVQLITYVSLPVAGGLIALSLCSVLGIFSNVADSAASHMLERISEDPTRNFFVGFIATAYLSLLRPSLAAGMPFLPYFEWVAIALTIFAMYSKTRLPSNEFYVSSEGLGWRRHAQEVKRETGPDLVRITDVMEQFVEDGVKEPLLVYLSLHLQRLGETEEEILKTLRPLVEYQKNALRHKLHLFAFPWIKSRRDKMSREVRENLLRTLLEEINRLGSE